MSISGESITRTTCPYCGTGCGVLAKAAPDGSVTVEGDPDHPANFGKLCPKGANLAQTLGHERRLLAPYIGEREASWDDALALVARRFGETIAEHGPDSVALYVSGQILTEDYYVANKLAKGYWGTANIDTNSRLCMASSVAGHKRAFGADTVPNTYADMELADLVVLVGSNLAFCHPILFSRLAAAKAARPHMKVVLIDPRRTVTADIADLHLPLLPGSDVALYLGLLTYLASKGNYDRAYIEAHTTGFDEALREARGWNPMKVAHTCDIEVDDVLAFYELVAGTDKTLTIYSQGVNQSSSGTDKVNAIINTHLVMGRIGREGCGPFSVTGQPNAMGGREVGGLANMLAAHMEIADPAHRAIVQGFWGSPTLADKPGLKAVDLYKAVAEGRIKALWIMATNPVDSLPDADAVRAALAACPFVVTSEVEYTTDTAPYAHVRLPALAWGEKDGTVTNSERRISRQRAFMPPPRQARADWAVLADVGRRMGWPDAFAWKDAAAVFREYAAMTGVENDGSRDLDLSGLAQLDSKAYDALPPVMWPVKAGESGLEETRFFAQGGFYTPDRKGRFVPTPHRAAASVTDADYPLILNTGRVRDQWHTMTRTVRAPRLANSVAEPFAEIHPEDAARLGIDHATLVRISSPRAHVVVRALITDRQRRGAVFVPMHWTDVQASKARVNALVAPHVDPVSGQPESKFTPVRLAPERMDWFAFVVADHKPARWPAGYWAQAQAEGGVRAELAGTGPCPPAKVIAEQIFGARRLTASYLAEYTDVASDEHRVVLIENGVVVGLVFVGPHPVAASRSWLASRLGEKAGPAVHRILAGMAGAGGADQGRIICGCKQVGERGIVAALEAGCKPSVIAIGEATGAGTGCGSCAGEIARVMSAYHAREVAEVAAQ